MQVHLAKPVHTCGQLCVCCLPSSPSARSRRSVSGVKLGLNAVPTAFTSFKTSVFSQCCQGCIAGKAHDQEHNVCIIFPSFPTHLGSRSSPVVEYASNHQHSTGIAWLGRDKWRVHPAEQQQQRGNKEDRHGRGRYQRWQSKWQRLFFGIVGFCSFPNNLFLFRS
jgi:hypothetical protein